MANECRGSRGASKVLTVYVEAVDAVLRLSSDATGGVQLGAVAERNHHLQMRVKTGGGVGSQCRLGGRLRVVKDGRQDIKRGWILIDV